MTKGTEICHRISHNHPVSQSNAAPAILLDATPDQDHRRSQLVEALNDRDEAIHREASFESDEVVIPMARSHTLPALPPVAGIPLRFASGEAVAPRTVPAEKPKARAHRRPYLDWFDLAVIVLIVVCATVCVYRIFWAL